MIDRYQNKQIFDLSTIHLSLLFSLLSKMSSKVDVKPTIPDTLLKDISKQQPLTVREKIVNLFQDLEITRDEQRRVNSELEKEIQSRIEAESEAAHLRRQVQLVEVNLDNATTRVNHVTTQLIEVIKVSEAARQYDLFLKKFPKNLFSILVFVQILKIN